MGNTHQNAEEVVDEVVEETIENTVDPELDEDGDAVEAGKEPWQLTEEEEEEPSDVPLDKVIKMKERLKGRIKERDSELERIREELEQLKRGSKSNSAELPPRPKADDFDTDEEYESELDKWHDKRIEAKLSEKQAASNEAQTTQQQKEQIAKAVDSHYERTAKLVQSSGMKPEVFKEADESFRKSVDIVFPNSGDEVAENIISLVGEGSEKVMLYIGRNKSARAEFQSLLAEDKTGLKAMLFLGAQKERLNNPKRTTSGAPKPASNASGEANLTPSGTALKKKYDEARKKKDVQTSYDLKKKARSSGVDVSSW